MTEASCLAVIAGGITFVIDEFTNLQNYTQYLKFLL